jgi:hypothetical protein
METLDENFLQNDPSVKQRHGCVTAWLILMIVANSLVALIYLFAGDTISKNVPGGMSTGALMILAVLSVLNVVFAVLLFQYKKWGFYGFIGTSAGALIINLSVGSNPGQAILGLAGIAILYGILQIKKDNITTWEHLE